MTRPGGKSPTLPCFLSIVAVSRGRRSPPPLAVKTGTRDLMASEDMSQTRWEGDAVAGTGLAVGDRRLKGGTARVTTSLNPGTVECVLSKKKSLQLHFL